MKKKLQAFVIFLALFCILLPITASADTAPKPSITVNFENVIEQDVYCTYNYKKVFSSRKHLFINI